jgi:Protein of unknown function (DUF3892)
MPTSRQIACINKKDRYSASERITHVGGTWGKIPESEAINHIRLGIYTYHVKVGGVDVPVEVDYREGVPYLKTKPDWTKRNNLLSLPECP